MSGTQKMKEMKNPMAEMPVGRLMLTMGMPMILSMMLQALYNIVDSAFVSNMPETGEAALNALTLAFPVQMLMVAIGVGTGVGTNALVARCLGQGDREKASHAAGNAMFLATMMFVFFFLFGVFGTEVYVNSQTSDLQIRQMTISYLKICCMASFGIAYFSAFEKIIQATGRSIYSTIGQIAGAVTNIVLDPILIYGFCGLPKLGVAGAAWATVIGQVVSFVLVLVFHLRYDRELKNGLSYMKPSGHLILEIYSIGFPAIIAQALMSFMTYAMNLILGSIDVRAVTAYGLYYKIQQFILFAAFGLRDAITPIVAFNHGKRDKKRIQAGVRYGMEYTLIIMAAGLVLLEVFAKPLTGIFGLSGETAAICESAVRVISLSFLFAGANVAFQGCFQALDSGLESLFLSLCRQFLFVIPVAWGFSKLVLNGSAPLWLVWMTFLIAEGVTTAIGCIFMRRIWKNKIMIYK